MHSSSTKFSREISSFDFAEFVDLQKFGKWQSSCKLLLTYLGPFSSPWESTLGGTDKKPNYLIHVLSGLGALESILDNLTKGRLARIEDLVAADTFANVIEQAEHLLESQYYLAAGVLFRAVLEEKLRGMCETANCKPAKPRPTMQDYVQALRGAAVIDKITVKAVESMAGIGNAAAHNEAGLTIGDVKQLHSSLLSFLQKFCTLNNQSILELNKGQTSRF